MMNTDYAVTNNKKAFKFEITLPDSEVAFIEYRWLKGNIVLMRTLVPTSARGQGLGSFLAKYVLDYARDQNLKVVVYCAFIAKYIENHGEYNNLVVK